MNVNLGNGWGIVRTIDDLCLKQPAGKYVLLKDPNKVRSLSFLFLFISVCECEADDGAWDSRLFVFIEYRTMLSNKENNSRISMDP